MAKCSEKDATQTNRAKAIECLCDHLPEISDAIQIKINAFSNLIERRPEIKNRMVKIKGVFGHWYVNPKDFEKNTLEDLRKRYNCK